MNVIKGDKRKRIMYRKHQNLSDSEVNHTL